MDYENSYKLAVIPVWPLRKDEIPLIVSYFFSASPVFLKGMGADPNKLPNKQEWAQSIENEIDLPLEKKSYSIYSGFTTTKRLDIPTLPF